MRSWLKQNLTAVIAVAVTLLFAVANSALLIRDFYYLSLIPLAGIVLLLFITKLETGLLCTALLTPFAINFALIPKMELSMPVEPMMILFSFLLLHPSLDLPFIPFDFRPFLPPSLSLYTRPHP